MLRCSMWPGNHCRRTVKAWDVRAMGCESSKRGQGCLASLEIHGAGVWAIDWMQQENGNWLGAVAGMCEPSLCHLPRRMLLRCLCSHCPRHPPTGTPGFTFSACRWPPAAPCCSFCTPPKAFTETGRWCVARLADAWLWCQGWGRVGVQLVDLFCSACRHLPLEC